MDDQTPRQRFRRKEWLARVRELEAESRRVKAGIKAAGCGPSEWTERYNEGPHSIPYALENEKAELTLLYSIRAHLRGRLHRRWDGHGEDRVELTLESQRWLVQDYLEEWLEEAEERPASAA
jgi:hypothetical protein